MSTVQKLALGASLVGLLGVVVYDSYQNARLRNQNAALRQQSEALVERIKVLQMKHENAARPAVPSEASAVAGLDEEQKRSLQDMTHGLQTGNSVNDIDRLKDSLARWDELFMNPAPEKAKPVLAILKERVRRRIAQLEEERQQNPP